MLLQIPGILGPGELETLRAELRGEGFEDGAGTAGSMARTVKRNLQLAAESPAAKKCAPMVLEALQRNPVFFSAALPQRIQGPVFNRYDPGMTYGDHVDNALMGMPAPVRSDVAATLFLSDLKDYDGGELVVHDRFGAQRVKLPAGSIVVYPASSTHRVEPIGRGSRLAAVMWIQSFVRDAAQRQTLFELDLTIGALREKAPSAAGEITTLTALYHNLLRMWSET